MSDLCREEFAATNAALTECFRLIERPQHRDLQILVQLWQDRPEDGFEIGRDIPSRRFAPFLSHILFWEPLPDGSNWTLRLCGEALRLRFGDNAVGKHISELIAPEVLPHFLDMGKRMRSMDFCDCYDMHLLRREKVEGLNELLFELVAFPVWSRGRTSRYVLNGIFYFL